MAYRKFSVVARYVPDGPIVRFCQHGEGNHGWHATAAWCFVRNRRVTKANGGPFLWSIRNDRPNR